MVRLTSSRMDGLPDPIAIERGGDNDGGIADEAFSMVGDIILGVEGGKKKRMKRKRVGGPIFAWEDEEDDADAWIRRSW